MPTELLFGKDFNSKKQRLSQKDGLFCFGLNSRGSPGH